jgi:hypothetical protein
MTYEDVCLAYNQPGTPAPLAGLSAMVRDAQARAAREREIGLGQAQFLVWLAWQMQQPTGQGA